MSLIEKGLKMRLENEYQILIETPGLMSGAKI